MLPILRIIPVGGVFLAILILVLSLGAPGGSRTAVPPALWAARGPLIQIEEHPEWRQFLMRAALQRADEIHRLRDLADDPVHSGSQDDAKVAGLPIERSDADPEDITSTINESPAATIPIDIGETSSTELPNIRLEEKPPVVITPSRLKSQITTRHKTAHRIRRAKPVKPEPPQLSFFEVLFGPAPIRQSAAPAPQANQKTAVRTDLSQR